MLVKRPDNLYDHNCLDVKCTRSTLLSARSPGGAGSCMAFYSIVLSIAGSCLAVPTNTRWNLRSKFFTRGQQICDVTFNTMECIDSIKWLPRGSAVADEVHSWECTLRVLLEVSIIF